MLTAVQCDRPSILVVNFPTVFVFLILVTRDVVCTEKVRTGALLSIRPVIVIIFVISIRIFTFLMNEMSLWTEYRKVSHVFWSYVSCSKVE